MKEVTSTPASEEDIRGAVDELRCALSTIAGLAEANGYHAVSEIARTARAGLARLDRDLKDGTTSTKANPE